MDSLLHIGITNAILATALALFVGVFTCWCRRPAVVHALWLLVLLKLLVPPLFSISIGDPFLVFARPAEALATTTRMALAAEMEPAETGPDVALAAEDTGEGAALALHAGLTTDAPPASPLAGDEAAPFPWQSMVGWCWIVGSVLFLAFTGVRLRRVQRLLAYCKEAPRTLQDRADRLGQKMALTAIPSIWLLSGRVSPMVWGLLGSPRLVLPAALWNRLDESQRDALLVHELAHIRRGDHWVRRLELVVTVLFWWHPVVWWARRRLHEAEEECCDAWVVATLPAAAEAYADALLATVAYLCQSGSALPLGASGAGTVHLLKRRLVMILNGTTPKALSRLGGLAVLNLAGVLLPLGLALGQDAPAGRTEPAGQDAAPAARSEQPRPSTEIRRARTQVRELEANLQNVTEQLEELRDRLQEAQARLAKLEGRSGRSMPAAGTAVERPQGGVSMHGLPATAPAARSVGFGVAAPAALAAGQGTASTITATTTSGSQPTATSTATFGLAATAAGQSSFGAAAPATGTFGLIATVPAQSTSHAAGVSTGTVGQAATIPAQSISPVGAQPERPRGRAPSDQEMRLRNLEKKLDLLLKEMESLRRQRTAPQEEGLQRR
ncbi:MAG TPA: M56 family metallopeptidase [Gemmataceae bacterium]|nr:M56 family metallopeptidase [Gemmataceae bacterium]